MKVKLTNKRIMNDFQGLTAISEKELPIKASYAIAKNFSKIKSVAEIYDKERLKVLNKYANKDDQNNMKMDELGRVDIPQDKLKNVENDINELMDIENEIDIHMFNISVLENCSMPSKELMLIDYMIEE